MRRDEDWMEDILEGIEQIRKYSVEGRERFEKDELVQNWILRHLEIIGEAAGNVSLATRKKAVGVPWQEIIGMRNILAHEYFGIDLEIIWNVVEKELSKLEEEVKKLSK